MIAQFIRICRWLQLIHKDRLAPLENAPFPMLWARKRYRVAQRFCQYLRATNYYKLSDAILLPPRGPRSVAAAARPCVPRVASPSPGQLLLIYCTYEQYSYGQLLVLLCFARKVCHFAMKGLPLGLQKTTSSFSERSTGVDPKVGCCPEFVKHDSPV